MDQESVRRKFEWCNGCLIPARTDTTYWHDFIFDKADDIKFLKGRLKFGNSKNSAPFPSAIVIYECKEAEQ